MEDSNPFSVESSLWLVHSVRDLERDEEVRTLEAFNKIKKIKQKHTQTTIRGKNWQAGRPGQGTAKQGKTRQDEHTTHQ